MGVACSSLAQLLKGLLGLWLMLKDSCTDRGPVSIPWTSRLALPLGYDLVTGLIEATCILRCELSIFWAILAFVIRVQLFLIRSENWKRAHSEGAIVRLCPRQDNFLFNLFRWEFP